MGYHLNIINTEKNTSKNKVLSDFDQIKTRLTTEFDFVADYKADGTFSLFYHKNNETYLLFYDRSEQTLWTSTPDDELVAIMIKIAQSFQDGSRVRGDEYETYLSMDETMIHPDDRPFLAASLEPSDKKESLIFNEQIWRNLKFCFLICFVVFPYLIHFDTFREAAYYFLFSLGLTIFLTIIMSIGFWLEKLDDYLAMKKLKTQSEKDK